MSPRVVVVGSVNVDLFARVPRHPVPGETVLGTGGVLAPGGKGANQALAARLQGAEVRLVGAVGGDPNATVALRLLEEAGVDLSAVSVDDAAPTGLAVITVADDGENTIVVVSGANATVTQERALAALRDLSPEDVVLMQGELPPDVTATTLRAAAGAVHRVVLNLAPYGDLDEDVLQLCDPLVVNEHEARAVARMLGASVTTEEDLAAGLCAAGVPSVVVTLGPRGAVIADSTGVTSVSSPRVEVVDTTGAGDAFTGALAARLAAGDTLARAAAHAARVGAYAVQHPGAQPSYPAQEDTLP